MDMLCGPELKLEKRDFLGHGDDRDGKGDYQGCGEFNPALLFSQEDQSRFDQDGDKTDRNEANAPNRRVMVLIFRRGSRVSPSKWPCPRVNEGTAGCTKRFWSDGEKRRSTHLQGAPRKFEESKDTFACRFYHRLTSKGPCERIVVRFSFRLYDLERRFIKQAPFELSIDGRPPVKDHADDEGFVVVPDVEVPAQIFIRWGFPPEGDEEARMVFEGEMFLQPDETDRQTEARQKLQNLGYSQEISLDENVAAFRRDYGQLGDPPLPEEGGLDDAALTLLRDVWAGAADDLLKDKPERTANS